MLNSILARKSLGWRTAHELHWGDTPDISMFRFYFWQPVWYYNPNVAFPSPKMLKGRFLGFAQNVADSFCYLILTNTSKEGDKPSILSRSVVRPRYKDEDPSVYSNTDEKKLIIFKHDKVTPLEDPELEIIKLIIDFSAKYNAIEEEGPVKRKRDDGFDENIVEVLRPPTKRPKLYSKSLYLPSPQAITQIQPVAIAEEIHTTLRSNKELPPPTKLSITLPTTKKAVDVIKNTRLKDLNIDQLNHESIPVANEISKLDPQSAEILEEISHQLTRLDDDRGDDEGFIKNRGVQVVKW